MPPRGQTALHRSLLLLLLGATILALPDGAAAAQLRFDAIGTLGGPTTHATYGLSDTGGLSFVGRSAGGTFVEWAGFWFPRGETTSGVSETPDDSPPGDTPGNGQVLPLATRLVGIFPNPVGREAEIRFDIAASRSIAIPGAVSGAVSVNGSVTDAAAGTHASGEDGRTGSSGNSSDVSSVRVELFDVNGRLAARVFDGDLPPGTHHLSWQPGSRGAGSVANGIYFFRFTCGNHQETRRIAFLR